MIYHHVGERHRRGPAEPPSDTGRRHAEPHAVLLDGQRAGVAVQQQPDDVARVEPLLPILAGCLSFVTKVS